MQAKLTDFDEKKLPGFTERERNGFIFLILGFIGFTMMLFGFMSMIKDVEGRGANFVMALVGLVPFTFAVVQFRRLNKVFQEQAASFDKFSCEELFKRVSGRLSERHFNIILGHRARNSHDIDFLKYRIVMSQPSEERIKALQVLEKNPRVIRELTQRVLERREKAKKLIKARWLVVICAVIGFAPGLYSLLPGANALYENLWFSSLVAFGVLFAMMGGLFLWTMIVFISLRNERQAVRRVVTEFDLAGLEVLLNSKQLLNDVVPAIKERKNRGDSGAVELFKKARKLQIRDRGF